MSSDDFAGGIVDTVDAVDTVDTVDAAKVKTGPRGNGNSDGNGKSGDCASENTNANAMSLPSGASPDDSSKKAAVPQKLGKKARRNLNPMVELGGAGGPKVRVRYALTQEADPANRQETVISTYLEGVKEWFPRQHKCITCGYLETYCMCGALKKLALENPVVVKRCSSSGRRHSPMGDRVDSPDSSSAPPREEEVNTSSEPEVMNFSALSGGVSEQSVRFLLLFHFKEPFRSSNTGKILDAFFPRSDRFIAGLRSEQARLEELLGSESAGYRSSAQLARRILRHREKVASGGSGGSGALGAGDSAGASGESAVVAGSRAGAAAAEGVTAESGGAASASGQSSPTGERREKSRSQTELRAVAAQTAAPPPEEASASHPTGDVLELTEEDLGLAEGGPRTSRPGRRLAVLMYPSPDAFLADDFTAPVKLRVARKSRGAQESGAEDSSLCTEPTEASSGDVVRTGAVVAADTGASADLSASTAASTAGSEDRADPADGECYPGATAVAAEGASPRRDPEKVSTPRSCAGRSDLSCGIDPADALAYLGGLLGLSGGEPSERSERTGRQRGGSDGPAGEDSGGSTKKESRKKTRDAPGELPEGVFDACLLSFFSEIDVILIDGTWSQVLLSSRDLRLGRLSHFLFS